MSKRLRIRLDGGASVSARLDVPQGAAAVLVLAHGAGAGMEHPFMRALACGLSDRGIAVLRYQFPFMEKGSRRPDTPAVAHAAVRAAVATALRRCPALPVFAGGKSFGGRMTSQAQAGEAMPGVCGLCLIGFPLHPPRQPSTTRALHLESIDVPMLFLQGTRDERADGSLMAAVVKTLGRRASHHAFADADHGFHVRVRSGTTDAAVLDDLLDRAAAWIRRRATGARRSKSVGHPAATRTARR